MKMALWTSLCLSCLTSLTALGSFATTQHVRGDVTDLIYSLQYRYCGRQFCSVDENYQPPICPPKSSQTNTDVDLETVGVGTLQGLVKQDNSSTVKQDNSSTVHPLEGSNMSTTAVPIQYQVCPPCLSCSCSDDCEIFGTCCVDKHIGSEYFFDCENILTYSPSIHGQTYGSMYLIVAKCPSDAPNYSLDLAMKCDRKENNRPVTSSHRYGGNVTFKNEHCASCYDIANYTLWDVYLTCGSDFDMSNFTDLSALIRSAKEKHNCYLSYRVNKTSFPKECVINSPMISTCNVTGKWREYNSTLEEACHMYVNLVTRSTYRNLFCYLCNGEDVEELECPIHCYTLRVKPVVITAFAALLNFEKSEVEVLKSRKSEHLRFPLRRIGRQNESQCGELDVYDSLSAKCREVYCSFVTDDNSTCKVLSAKVITVWYLTAHIIDEIPIALFMRPVSIAVAKSLGVLLLQKCGLDIQGRTTRDYASFTCTSSRPVVQGQLELALVLPPNEDLALSRRCLKDLNQSSLDVKWGDKIIQVYLVSEDRPWNNADKLLLSAMGFGASIIGQIETIRVPLAFNISCPLVRFQEEEVEIENNSVVIHGFNELSVDEFFVTKKKVYYICMDAVLEEPIIQMKVVVWNKDVEYLVEQIITAVCLSFSLLFLLLTLIVYLMVRNLHTIPGLNLVMLTASLFVAQALYLFGSGTVTTPTICTVLGVLIHYFWLVSFAWMNICCFHMYRVFTNLFSSLDLVGKTSSTLLKYAAFAYCIPLVIIITTLTTTYIRSDYTSIAYGGTSVCFVEGGLVSMVSFGVPAGLMVIINSGLLLYTTLLFHRNSTENPRAGKRDTSDISKFFKLSTITGMSWLFGFLGYFLGRKELVYVFTVLTASQGVFIFWAFVASRRVLHMAREVMGCQKKKGDRISSSGDSHNGKRVDSAPQFTSSTSSEIA